MGTVKPTVESIRARHDGLCTGCDIAILLAAVDRRGAWAALWKSYAARLRRKLQHQQRRNDQLEAALTARNETIRSLRQQIKYLAEHQTDKPRKVGEHRHAVIMSLRRKLRHVREQLDLQTEATKRQKERTRRLAAYIHGAPADRDRLADLARQHEADAAVLRIALQTIADGWYLATHAKAIAAVALENTTAGRDLLADYQESKSDADKVKPLAQRNNTLYTALLRARDELEELTGEAQPWIDAAICGQAPAVPTDRPLSVGEWADLKRQVGG